MRPEGFPNDYQEVSVRDIRVPMALCLFQRGTVIHGFIPGCHHTPRVGDHLFVNWENETNTTGWYLVTATRFAHGIDNYVTFGGREYRVDVFHPVIEPDYVTWSEYWFTPAP